MRCKTQPDDSLTFSEAMALDPSEVEVWHHDRWSPLLLDPEPPYGDWLFTFLRSAKFRHIQRQKRSRVDDMAIAKEGAFDVNARERSRHYAEAIREVCEYLDLHVYRSTGCAVSKQIERAFLEPK